MPFTYPEVRRDESVIDDYKGTKVAYYYYTEMILESYFGGPKVYLCHHDDHSHHDTAYTINIQMLKVKVNNNELY
jgi:hypothetical protein